MRGILLGVLGGLVIGSSGMYAYEHYLGDGQQLVQTQAQLDSANASLTKNTQDSQELKSETAALSDQVQQLSSKNDDLKNQVEELKQNSTTGGAAPAANPMANMMQAGLEQQFRQKLLVLKSRLHLTPDQEATVTAAMDEELKRMEAMFAGGKIDPQAMANLQGANSLDKTLDSILTPDQKATYQQIQTDEKNSAVETMANYELNQMTPLLQLSDSQKDQVYSALAQVQSNVMDPNWVKNNLAGSTDPVAILEAQAKAKEDALANILTPDQLATYHQQAQSQLDLQKAMLQKSSSAPAASAAP
jgi:chromosome segregation ATPase